MSAITIPKSIDKPATLRAYSADLYYHGCTSREKADKLIFFAKNKKDAQAMLDVWKRECGAHHMAFVYETALNTVLKTAPIFLVPRYFCDEANPLQPVTQAELSIKFAATWLSSNFDCPNAEEILRAMIEEQRASSADSE